jgi:predicted membrane protein
MTSSGGWSFRERIMRGAALALAGLIATVLLVAPRLVGRELDPLTHSALPLLLFGMSGAFVYGLGFEPEAKLLRVLLGPLASTACITVALTLILFHQH